MPVMSATKKLTKDYTSFFIGCADFAIYPYTGTFTAIAVPENPGDDTNIVGAAIAVGILTFVVPILPTLCSITFSMVSVAVSLAVSSMFILYPIALLQDFLEPTSENQLAC